MCHLETQSMIYLKKDQRQQQIQNVAINIAIKEGLTAITARRIATEANIAIGQIHHHFESISQLKAITLLMITEQYIDDFEKANKQNNIFERIVNLISPITGEHGIVFRRLWSEAAFLAEQDDYIKNAYKSTMEDWHKAMVKLLQQAKKTGEFTVKRPKDIAWRLIALSCGLDSILLIESGKMTDDLIRSHVQTALKLELRIP